MSPQSWDERLVWHIAFAIRRLRKEQQMSAQKLADRTTELGYTVSRTTVSDLENGRRKYITVTELLLLAAALNTTPAALVYPGPCTRDMEALPDTQVPEALAVQWFGGSLATPPPWADPDLYEKNRADIATAISSRQQQLLAELAEIKAILANTARKVEGWSEVISRDE